MTFHEGAERLAQALLLPINPAAVVLLGIYTVVWGFWVANPFWTVFTQAPLYDKLGAVALGMVPPEVFWGVIAMVCGSITIYGAIKRSYKPLVRGATIAFFHWLVIAVMYFLGDPLNTGGITALTFAVYAGFIYLNLRVNFKDRKDSDAILNPVE